ncbi:MAG TPA: hypothetical protein VFS67_37710 [Polyangiaceae bacterium]|nr:hypothetical protein [Polyangiaceae bacterium]
MLHLFRPAHPVRANSASLVASREPEHSQHGPRARYTNMALGLWLFVSAFAWPHTTSTRLNTCMVGLFVTIAATMAAGVSVFRQLTSVLAVWLLFTTLMVYPASPITFWSNILTAVAVLVVSLIPSDDERITA